MICPSCGAQNIQGQDQCENCGMDLAGVDVQAWGVSPQDPLLNVSLAELPLKEPPILGSEDSAAAAARLMKEKNEGCVFVMAPDQGLVGVFSERDLATRVVARSLDAEETLLGQVMTPRPFTLQKQDRLAFALHRMGVDGYRHVPVMDGSRLAGFLSMRTVLGVLARA